MPVLSIMEGWGPPGWPFLECFGRGKRESCREKESRSFWLFLFHAACSVLGVSKNTAKYIRKLASKCDGDASFLKFSSFKLFVVLKSVLILLHLFC